MGNFPELPDGTYPFMDERHPLSEMAFGLTPESLRTLIAQQAARAGTTIVRDEPVELRLADHASVDATFMVFWPSESADMYLLMPKRHIAGRA